VTNVALGLTRTLERKRSWLRFFQGLFGIAVGVLAFLWPHITAFALLMWVAAWAIVVGAFEIAAAIRLRRIIEGEWRLALAGTFSILFGALLLAFPALAAVGLVWALGAYAVATGILQIALAVRLKARPLLA
jgi:uncharacterized membrane protein HdeD (DUF308 family)